MTLALIPFRPAAAANAHAVAITSFSFSPAILSVHEDDTVTWTNNDPVINTLWFVKSDGTTLALSPPLSPGDSYTLAFPSCGQIDYFSFEHLWVSGMVNVLLRGEVNGDGKVNIIDLALVGAAFGSDPLSGNWNPDADLNKDNRVNIIDLVIVGANFGRVC